MKPVSLLSVAFVASLAASSLSTTAQEPKAAPAPAPAPAPGKTAQVTDPVATVNGEAINKADLDNALQQELASQGRDFSQVPEEFRLIFYHRMLPRLVAERLVAKQAENTKVSDEEIDKVIAGLKANFPTEKEFEAQLAATGQNLDAVKKDVRRMLQQRTWIEAQVGDKGNVTEAEAETFYKANPEAFTRPEQVRASHILVRVEQDATPEQVIAKEKVAKDILGRVKKGEDFGALAKELSEDPSAKQNSGDLDFFAADEMVPEFSNAAFKMKKGDISEPVRSQFGFHIIKLTDRKPGGSVPLEEVKGELMAFLKQQKQQGEFQKVIEGLRAKADVKVNLPPAPELPIPGAAIQQQQAPQPQQPPVEAVTPPVSVPGK